MGISLFPFFLKSLVFFVKLPYHNTDGKEIQSILRKYLKELLKWQKEKG